MMGIISDSTAPPASHVPVTIHFDGTEHFVCHICGMPYVSTGKKDSGDVCPDCFAALHAHFIGGPLDGTNMQNSGLLEDDV